MMTIHVLLSDDQQRWKNVLLFTSLAAFGVLPMVHASFVLPLQSTLCPLPPPMQVIDLIYSAQPVIANAHHRVNLMLLCMYALYALGGVLYLVRIPEKLYPGLFDRMGHSHQLMHVFVMAAAMLQLWIVLDLNQWASTVPCCNQ
jgi:adiponectin receptor